MQALGRRLECESIEKVSVASLAREAGVDRQTFYYYFADIYDALDCYCARELPLFEEASFWSLPMEARIERMLSLLDEKRDIVRVVWRADGDALVERHVRAPLRASIESEVERALARAGKDGVSRRRDIAAAADYLSVAICSIDIDWVMRAEGRCSVAEMCRRQRALLRDTIAGLVG